MTPNSRAYFGFALLGVWAALIGVIALGNVRPDNSYGLLPCITALAGLSGAYAQSTFGNHAGDKKEDTNGTN